MLVFNGTVPESVTWASAISLDEAKVASVVVDLDQDRPTVQWEAAEGAAAPKAKPPAHAEAAPSSDEAAADGAAPADAPVAPPPIIATS